MNVKRRVVACGGLGSIPITPLFAPMIWFFSLFIVQEGRGICSVIIMTSKRLDLHSQQASVASLPIDVLIL